MQIPIKIHYPVDGYYAGIIRVGLIHAEQERERRKTLADQLKRFFMAEKSIRTIDCFDISHKQGYYMVGSCVRFTDGQPDKNKFRRFKIKTQLTQNDYASLREIVSRRYHESPDVPDLILIDGGKGQLSSVQGVVPGVELASIAKREETIFSHRFPDGKILDQSLYISKVLIALRDYTHHFAISYHRVVEAQEMDLEL